MQKAKALIDKRINELNQSISALRSKVEADQKTLKQMEEELREFENAKARL